MITHSQKNSPRNQGGALAKVLIIIAIVVAVVFGKTVGEKAIGAIAKAVEQVQGVQKFPEDAWTVRQMGDLSVESPVSFGAGPDIRGKLPAEVQKKLVHFVTYGSDKSVRAFQVFAVKAEYVADVPLSLDGAAEGAIQQVAATAGDSAPKFTITPGTLDDLESRQSVYHAQTAKGSLFMDGLFVKKGQTMWQISVVYSSETSRENAQRLLKSVHLKPAPAP